MGITDYPNWTLFWLARLPPKSHALRPQIVFTRHLAGELCRTLGQARMRSSHTANARSAVVIGGELNGLGVCRSLGEGNVSTYVLDPHHYNPAMWSRHATPVKARKLYGPNLLEALRSLQGRLGGRPVLIVTDEMA
jgi:hypothetical protein